MKSSDKKRLINLSLIFAFFFLIALIFTSEKYFKYLYKKEPYSFFNSLKWSTVSWLPWAVFCIFIVKLSKRFIINKENWKRTVPIHFVFAVFFSTIHSVIFYFVYRVVYFYSGKVADLDIFLFILTFISLDILTYWIIIGVIYSLNYYHKYQEKKLKASQLEAHLAKSQLEVLKMQLHPHFLFNSLNAISALIRKDKEAAEKMLTQLSDILRMSLENSGLQEVPLKEELEFLNRYFEIQKIRFGDRLNIRLNINLDTYNALIPNLILQPLVENAIRHGISPRDKGGTIEIDSRFENEKLIMNISDDGVGLKEDKDAVMKKGFGLSSTKERLKHLYGKNHDFDIKNRESGGVKVTMEIPVKMDNLFSKNKK